MKLFSAFFCYLFFFSKITFAQNDQGIIEIGLNGSIIKNTSFNDQGKIKVSQKTPGIELGYYYTDGRSINASFSILEVKVNSFGNDNFNGESGIGIQSGLGYFFQGNGEKFRPFAGMRVTYQGGKLLRTGEDNQLYLGVAGGLKYSPVEGGALAVWANLDKDIISEEGPMAFGVNIGVVIRLR